VQHTVGKISRRATTLVETSSRSELGVRSYERSKSQESKPEQFWDSTLGDGCKCSGELQKILYGGRWWLPPSPGRGESNESKVACGLSEH